MPFRVNVRNETTSLSVLVTVMTNSRGDTRTDVLARFDALEARLDAGLAYLDRRLVFESNSVDTKAILERTLNEIVEARRELSKRLDQIEAIAHQTRADLRDAEDRVDRLETRLG